MAVLTKLEEIVLPETRSASSSHEAQDQEKRNLSEITSEKQRTVLVAPAPHTRIRG